MNDARLPAHLEVSGLLRRTEALGGFATVLRKGDPERGSIVLVILARGVSVAVLERILSVDGGYSWQRFTPTDSDGSPSISEFISRRARFDEDLWIVELDIPDAERFIAETTSLG